MTKASLTVRSLCLLLACAPAFAQQAGQPDFMAAADAYGQGRYARCVDILAAIARENVPFPRNGELMYAACLGGAGRIDEAIGYIDAQLPTGSIDVAELRDKDSPGLNAIRRSPQWPALLARAESSEREQLARLDSPLRDDMLKRMQSDQAARQAVIDHPGDQAAMTRMADVDRDNTAWLKQVIDARGWPGASLVGEDGAKAAWLLVQHADADPAFQAQVLQLMEAAVAKHDASPSDFALLTDRVLRHQGKPQRYGTQFETGEDGVMRMQPVEDAAHLDERRASVGLPSIADYKRMLGETYHQRVE